VKVQIDKIIKQVKMANHYRTVILEDLTEFIAIEKQTSEILLAGDFNEVIDSEQINQFLIGYGLFKVYKMVNRLSNIN